MESMQTVLIVIHLMVVLALIGVVLIQRSEGGGLGIGGGGGGSGGFFTARGTANVLTRATAILAGIFFITSLSLTIMAGWGRTPPALLNQSGAPSGPAVPAGGSILDQIRPQAPASQVPVPQVPSAPATQAPASQAPASSAPVPQSAPPAPAPAAPAPAAPAPAGSQSQ
jgi:preprotein translocase subunit SecG